MTRRSGGLVEQPETTPDGELVVRPGVVVQGALAVSQQHRIVRFRGRPMIEVGDPFPHFRPLYKDQFDELAYPVLGGKTRGQMGDVFAYLSHTSEDLSDRGHLLLFGRRDTVPGEGYRSVVWDMDSLSVTAYEPEDTVWRSPWCMVKAVEGQRQRVDFVMQLAGGDSGVYDDIMQSIAPLIMSKKPDGVIWWVGDGANGKSTLMDALYLMFPNQLASLTVKRLTDGRDTPSLNGQLGNVVKESSEGRIDDTEIYKSIGTHENFRVHKFHSQDDIEIRGNLHHIFNANIIPSFNDKGFSARRRTFVIPFNQRFESDPSFEERTFTPEFFGQMATEMGIYANKIKRQGYRYKWSAQTLGAKKDYDTEANNAEEYATELIQQGVVAFDSFSPIKMDYENWCADNGYVPLGVGNMRRAVQAAGFTASTVRGDDRFIKRYKLPLIEDSTLQPYGPRRPGIYTTIGFMPEEEDEGADEGIDLVKDANNIIKGEW